MRNFLEGLESRTFLSITPGGWTPPKLDATITADIKAVSAAQSQLSTDWKAAGPTIAADTKALGVAIKAAKAAVPTSLTTQLKTDEGTVLTDLKTLFKDYWTHAPAATITADKAALKTAETAVANDGKAIQTSINTNAGVMAAQAKLTTDSATVTADGKALQAAISKLFTDLKNHA